MDAANETAIDRFEDLFEVLRDLIKRVADTEDPNIRTMRAKVRAQLVHLESDMTPIVTCSQAPTKAVPTPPAASAPIRVSVKAPMRAPVWTQPAVVAFTGVVLALTVFRKS